MLQLTPEEAAIANGKDGAGAAMAMRILARACEMIGASSLVPIASAHIDGCLYHGDSGTLFAERLLALGAKVRVPATLNVGALDLLHHGRVKLDEHAAQMARRLMKAYVDMGCRQTWTCAPYQAGHRPALGEDVAWGESNAVVFCNSVLGARTNRYGDFLDICAAIAGRAPLTGLHLPQNRIAKILVDVSALDKDVVESEAFFAILGAWLGKNVGTEIAAIDGLHGVTEDRLKSLGAAAASTGAVGLFHVIGYTPEASDRQTAFGGLEPAAVLRLTPEDLVRERAMLSTA